jgi:hypothetical protein
LRASSNLRENEAAPLMKGPRTVKVRQKAALFVANL